MAATLWLLVNGWCFEYLFEQGHQLQVMVYGFNYAIRIFVLYQFIRLGFTFNNSIHILLFMIFMTIVYLTIITLILSFMQSKFSLANHTDQKHKMRRIRKLIFCIFIESLFSRELTQLRQSTASRFLWLWDVPVVSCLPSLGLPGVAFDQ